VFLGGLINYAIEHEKFFKEYVLAYTNAATLIDEGFQDTEELDGLFSGYDPEKRQYDTTSWQYAAPLATDPTLQDPRCVFQIVKRHFSRYTPEMVAELCGCSEEAFLSVAEAITA